MKTLLAFLVSAPLLLLGQEGIPVTDAVVKAKCGTCHPPDERGIMPRISFERTTPEGWQEAVKKMILQKGVVLTATEARSIVRYLSASHGLTPEEAKPVMYYAERRVHDEAGLGNDYPLAACTKCHPAARPMSWRRSPDDWNLLADEHAAQYKVARNDPAFGFLARTAPLHNPEWDSWSTRARASSNLTGRWLVAAHILGRGRFFGEMQVDPGTAPGEFTTRTTLRSAGNGETIARTGQTQIFGDYAWRGRSHGVNVAGSPPDHPSGEAREVMWLSPDQTRAEGRWFWGQYQEFGIDVELRRPSPGAMLLGVDRPSLKSGSQSVSVRLIGDNIPAQVTPRDLNLGQGINVRHILSHSSKELVVEVGVATNAAPGPRDIRLFDTVLETALAVYDRVDYIKATPESSMAAFGSSKYPRGFQVFEAIGYQRGPDGKPHTADDLELGPVDVTWSMEVFYALDASGNDKVGKVTPGGLLVPSPENPGANYDIWVVATAAREMNKEGTPLVGKGYVVVTVPEYTFNGHHYVRDLERWIEDGAW